MLRCGVLRLSLPGGRSPRGQESAFERSLISVTTGNYKVLSLPLSLYESTA